jgi:predicted DNA-binding helix-hairpin-helix protein
MNLHRAPSTLDKLNLAGDTTAFEPAGDTPAAEARRRPSPAELPCISQVSTPRGLKSVMKSMMTTACERNCFYCPFRAGRGKTQRVTFKPDEMASAFDGLQRGGAVDGLFLSSGIIKGSVTTQDKILDTVEIVRRRYGYRGYIHLKIMPGAEYDQLRRAMELADRISINLEGPNDTRLHALAPKKDFTGELLQRLAWAHELRAQGLRASSVTQFVVGAVGETDLELLGLTEKLHRQMSLTRAYYSAFHPIMDTPFENLNPTLPTRELRLYQASFLLRDYGWSMEELPFVGEGNLRLDLDPKRAWAEGQLRHQPIDLMRADRDALMRVPGIGPKGAAAILRARRTTALTDLGQLRKLGIRAPEQAAPFILLDGGRPPEQLPLF